MTMSDGIKYLAGTPDEDPIERALANETGWVHGLVNHVTRASGGAPNDFVGKMVLAEKDGALAIDYKASGFLPRAQMVAAIDESHGEYGRDLANHLRRVPSAGFFDFLVLAPGVPVHVRALKVIPFAGEA
jgi:hypothetical protein